MKVVVALLPLLILLAPSRADACSCMAGLPICQTFWQADAVFAGEVLSIEPVSAEDPLYSRKRVRFQVREWWRGEVAGVVEIRTGAGGGDCGYRFERGQTYIVYAFSNNDILWTGICSRTRKLAEAAEDLEYLKTARRPSDTGRIYGTVRDDQGQGRLRPAAARTVVLTDGSREWTATTDAEGAFEFRLPAGTYTMNVRTPAGEAAGTPRQITLADTRACVLADYYLPR